MDEIFARLDSLTLVELQTLSNEIQRRQLLNITNTLPETTDDALDKLEEMWFGAISNVISNGTFDIERIFVDEYEKLPANIRWKEINVGIPAYGTLPRCDDPQCWWNGNEDRLREYDGTLYQLVISDDIEYCEICHRNCGGHDEEYEELMNGLDNFIMRYDDWNVKNRDAEIREIIEHTDINELEWDDKWVRNVDTKLTCEHCLSTIPDIPKFTCIFGGDILCEKCVKEYGEKYEQQSLKTWLELKCA